MIDMIDVTDARVVLVCQVTLGIYAILLGVGGWFGYVRAKSRASFVAGSVSAFLVLAVLAYSFLKGPFFLWLGLLLSTLLIMVFMARFLRKRKFMPSGMLCVLSLGVFAVMLWGIVSFADTAIR